MTSATTTIYNSRIVQISHYSVKELLTSEPLTRGELSWYFIFPEPAHADLHRHLFQPDLHIGDNNTLSKKRSIMEPIENIRYRSWLAGLCVFIGTVLETSGEG